MRIISLCPSITETLFAIGAGDRVAAVTRYCTEPKAELRLLPRVGGTKNPDIVAIRNLQPDLVLVNAEENRQEDIETLGKEHRVDVSFPRHVNDVPRFVRHLGALAGCEEAAEGIARRVEGALEAAVSARRVPFRYVYLVWKEPWMVAGPKTYISSLCALAGGIPLEGVPERPDYPVVTLEWLRERKPDVILLPDEPYRFGDEHRQWWGRQCPEALTLLVSGDDFCWHGVRTLRGIDASCRLALDVAAVRSGCGGEPLPSGLEGRHERDSRWPAGPEG